MGPTLHYFYPPCRWPEATDLFFYCHLLWGGKENKKYIYFVYYCLMCKMQRNKHGATRHVDSLFHPKREGLVLKIGEPRMPALMSLKSLIGLHCG